ncbi:MAG: 4'-phosphopantetheinyl transferase superfamily protein [Methanobacterium sp.]|nr:4'-phosphopantetheinyl transferase superfamily protein [Methanobacterium sp.]
MLVYYMDVSQLDINQMEHFVSVERLEKTGRYIFQKDKKLSIGAELLLRYALIQLNIFNPVFGHDNYGKPFLMNHSHVYFNLSHSEEYVACAVSDSPVGVDIEQVHNIDLNIAQNYFFGSEYHHIQNSAHKQRTFFELWVLKESYMKMTGLGFRLPLDEFFIDIQNSLRDNSARIRVHSRDEKTDRLEHTGNQPEFGVWSVVGDKYILAVCSESRIIQPDLINLEDLKREIMSEECQNQRRGIHP